MLTALRIPKSFLNFEENAGDGKNLALMDVRFTRVINRIQQAFLMELTKVATIHLYLLGFDFFVLSHLFYHLNYYYSFLNFHYH